MQRTLNLMNEFIKCAPNAEKVTCKNKCFLLFVNHSINIHLYFKTSKSITKCFKLYKMEAKYFKLER